VTSELKTGNYWLRSFVGARDMRLKVHKKKKGSYELRVSMSDDDFSVFFYLAT
jgi:hypothetical protein